MMGTVDSSLKPKALNNNPYNILLGDEPEVTAVA